MTPNTSHQWGFLVWYCLPWSTIDYIGFDDFKSTDERMVQLLYLLIFLILKLLDLIKDVLERHGHCPFLERESHDALFLICCCCHLLIYYIKGAYLINNNHINIHCVWLIYNLNVGAIKDQEGALNDAAGVCEGLFVGQTVGNNYERSNWGHTLLVYAE